jgi:hypothetical protein
LRFHAHAQTAEAKCATTTRERRAMNLHTLEVEMARQAIFLFAVSILVTAICLWLTYLLIKLAIRDGIKESGLIEALRQRRTTTAKAEETTSLPEWSKGN